MTTGKEAYRCPKCGKLEHGSIACTTVLTQPYACPVCNGQGTVSRPPWIAGDQLTWESGSTEFFLCPACEGTGLVWSKL